MVCQWVPTNWLTAVDYKILIRTFAEVFDESSLWVINDAHTILLGSKNPMKSQFSSLEQKWKQVSLRSYLEESYYMNLADVMAHSFLGSNAIKEFVSDGPVNTDNRPVIENSRSFNKAPNVSTLTDILAMGGTPLALLAEKTDSVIVTRIEQNHTAFVQTLKGYMELIQK